MEIDSKVYDIQDYVVSLRRYFHQYPEASMKEFSTASKIEEELDKLGIGHERVGETGVIGYIGRDNPGRVIGLRADIDALEMEDMKNVDYKSKNKGLMHACGHDGHTAALLGAARLLKDLEPELNGQVRLLFQQAEEIGQGAKIFIEEGHIKDLDNVFGLHLDSRLEVGKVSATPGPIMASCDYFKARVIGKSGHVSAPHTAIDALCVGAQAVVNLQTIVSRQIDPMDQVVVGVGVLQSGTRYNIIANEAVFEGTFRTFSEETRMKTRESIYKIIRNTVDSAGASVDIEFKEFASPLINDIESTKRAIKLGREILGEENVIENQDRRLGSDDFSELLHEVPGVYVNIGSKNIEDKSTSYNHHHEKFDIDEAALLICTDYYTNYAVNFLNS